MKDYINLGSLWRAIVYTFVILGVTFWITGCASLDPSKTVKSVECAGIADWKLTYDTTGDQPKPVLTLCDGKERGELNAEVRYREGPVESITLTEKGVAAFDGQKESAQVAIQRSKDSASVAEKAIDKGGDVAGEAVKIIPKLVSPLP